MNGHETDRTLSALTKDQPLAVLATNGEDGPYATLVAVAVADDLRTVLFVTPRTTRKWANITADPRVSLLLDDRNDTPSDFVDGAAATFVGKARELTGEERSEALGRFLSRHPHLEDFATAPTTALFSVQVHRIVLVTRFQNVVEYHIEP